MNILVLGESSQLSAWHKFWESCQPNVKKEFTWSIGVIKGQWPAKLNSPINPSGLWRLQEPFSIHLWGHGYERRWILTSLRLSITPGGSRARCLFSVTSHLPCLSPWPLDALCHTVHALTLRLSANGFHFPLTGFSSCFSPYGALMNSFE